MTYYARSYANKFGEIFMLLCVQKRQIYMYMNIEQVIELIFQYMSEYAFLDEYTGNQKFQVTVHLVYVSTYMIDGTPSIFKEMHC
jgi:hypothetical protein